jgi:hypothetical protein
MYDQIIKVPLLDEAGDQAGQAQVFERGGKFVLYWNDGLVNEWQETYQTLTQALARLSVLHYAVGVGEFLTEAPHDFAASADDFVKSQILEMK